MAGRAWTVGDVLTTGQVAKICKVASRTVAKWFDAGKLKGYRVPLCEDRRVPRENLIRFMNDHGIPVPPELERGWAVILVGVDAGLAGRLTGELEAGGETWRVEAVPGMFDAGLAVYELRPVAVAVGLSVGLGEAREIARSVRHFDGPPPPPRPQSKRKPRPHGTLLVALAGECGVAAEEAEELAAAGFDHVLTAPHDAEELAGLLRAGRGAGR